MDRSANRPVLIHPLPPAISARHFNCDGHTAGSIELIGRRWLGAIVRVLVSGPARFNEILAAIPGLSDRLLTERLRELEHAGLVTRTVSPDRPVRVTYELTCQGQTLDTVMEEISTWAERWPRFAAGSKRCRPTSRPPRRTTTGLPDRSLR